MQSVRRTSTSGTTLARARVSAVSPVGGVAGTRARPSVGGVAGTPPPEIAVLPDEALPRSGRPGKPGNRRGPREDKAKDRGLGGRLGSRTADSRKDADSRRGNARDAGQGIGDMRQPHPAHAQGTAQRKTDCLQAAAAPGQGGERALQQSGRKSDLNDLNELNQFK